MNLSEFMMTSLKIGISGKLGSGKDYVVENFIVPKLKEACYKVAIVAFADHIKVNAAARNNLSIETMYGNKTPEIRKMLQIAGTEEGRDKYGSNIWIDTLDQWLTLRAMRDGTDVFIITDCRFINEVEWVTSQPGGFVIRIEAPDRNMVRLLAESESNPEILDSIKNHRSETELDGYSFECVIDNTFANIGSVSNDVINVLSSKLKLC